MSKIIAVDFDGTLVAHAYPKIGAEAPNAFRVLKKLQDEGHQLILWTMRSGMPLLYALDYCASKGIVFWGINSNSEQHIWSESPKAYAHLYIDDAALGCPTLFDERSQRLIVNWRDVESLLIRLGYLSH